MLPLLIFLVFASVSADLFPTKPYEDLSDETIQYIADYNRKLPTNNDAFEKSKCIDVTWNSCQFEFNRALGIDTSLTWRNATMLNYYVNQAVSTNTSEVVYVCNDFTRFYQCLGTSYYSCMDLYRLVGEKNANFQQAYIYVATYQRMQFMCNAGFEEVVRDYYCMKSLEKQQAYGQCLTTFNATAPQPNNLCNAVNTAMGCFSNVYGSTCGTNEASWYGCESFRSSFAEVCWGQRCNVGGFAHF